MKLTRSQRIAILSVTTLATFSLFWLSLMYEDKTELATKVDRHKAAQQCVERVAPLLRKESRFDGVRVTAWWGKGAEFRVDGWINNDADLAVLKQLIQTNILRVPVDWYVQVTTNSGAASTKQ